MRTFKLISALLCVSLPASVTAAEGWQHGIGTGIYLLNIDGDIGIETALGPVTADPDLDFDEIDELMESAFGLGGYSRKGKWTIHYSFGQMELEDDYEGSLPNGTPATVDPLTWTKKSAELAAEYNFAKNNRHHWGVLFGARHTEHEWEADVTIGATTVSGDFSQDWTDGVIGLTHYYVISKEWIWNSRVDVMFGDSDGGYLLDTGSTWRFANDWSARFYGSYRKYDFENGDEGDSDWYLYDAAEFGLGASIIYHY